MPQRAPTSVEPAVGPLTVVVVDPRQAPGLLTRTAWRALEAAEAVGYDADAAGHAGALREAGLPVRELPEPSEDGQRRPDAVGQGRLAWLCASAARAAELASAGPRRDVEVVSAPVAPTGAHLLDLVAVIDRLRSPGGCPWDAQQTHASLAGYVVEEAYELGEAIASGDRGEIADELGDVLLQVVFHARLAADDPAGPFDIDDVADRIVAKLRRRHPHVFADADATTPEQVEANWDLIKAAEKPERVGPLDGIPRGLPPLERAAKATTRLSRAGRTRELTDAIGALADGPGADLLRLAVGLTLAGQDPAVVLRDAVTAWQDRLT